MKPRIRLHYSPAPGGQTAAGTITSHPGLWWAEVTIFGRHLSTYEYIQVRTVLRAISDMLRRVAA